MESKCTVKLESRVMELAGVITLEWWSMAICALAGLIALASMLRSGRRARAKLPPGPRSLPLIGNMHQMRGDVPHQTLGRMAEQWGPIMFLRLGAKPLVVASSADAAREFLKTHDKQWAGRPRTTGGKIFTNFRNIVWAPYGPHWRHMKKICSEELFTQRRMESFRTIRSEEFALMVRSVYEDSVAGKPVMLSVKLGHLATNNITRMLLGKRLFGVDEAGQMEAHRFNVFVFLFFKVSSTLIVGDFLPWLTWVSHLSGTLRYMKKVKADMDEFLQQFLDLKKSGLSVDGKEDFVDVLLAQPSENGDGRLDDDAIKGVIQDMLIAGTDTSSSTAEWAIAELIRHPECMKKLQAEMDTVVGKNYVVSEMDIANLPYLQAVVMETLRLYPAAPLDLPHESIEPTTIWNFNFPTGTQLIVNLYAIQRDPKMWKDPNSFNPERFIEHPKIYMKGNQFQLIPFGAGRRQCPGMNLGILYVQMAVARLVQAFEFALPDGQHVATDLNMEETFAVSMKRKIPLTVVVLPRLLSRLY